MKKSFKKMLVIAAVVISQTSKAQVPTCPINLSPFPEYNKNSLLGDKVCPALSNLDKVVDGLSSNANKKIDEVKKELENFRKDIMDDVVNNKALEKFESAKGFAEKAKNDLLNLIKDKECGAPAAWNGMQRSFEQTGKDLAALATIAAKAGSTLTKLEPAFPELIKIAQSVADIATSINNQSPDIKKQFDALKAAVTAIVNDLKEIQKLDIAKAVKSGTGVATGLAPYVASCATCAGSTAAAIAGIAETAGGAAGGTAASETGIGAGIGAAVAVLGGGQTAAATLASTPTCAYMTANATKLGDYLDDLTTFINAVASITTSLSDNAEEVIKASKALTEIAKVLGKENEPNVKKIQQSMTLIADAINNTANGFEKDVTPLMVKFTNEKVKQIAEDAKQINKCYGKLTAAVGWITNDVVNGTKQLVTAAAGIVDVQKLTENIKKQFDNALTAATAETRELWNKLNANRDKLMRALLGDKPADPGAVAAHVITLGSKIDDIIKTAGTLAGNVGSFVSDVANNLAKASNSQINSLAKQIAAKQKEVEDVSRDIAIAMAKAKASAQAKLNLIAAQQNINTTIKVVSVLKPLTVATSLSVTVKKQ